MTFRALSGRSSRALLRGGVTPAAIAGAPGKWLGGQTGEVPQALSSYLVAPVTAYGADPTNTVSSVAAFKQALTNHARVFVPPGKYKIDSPILWQAPGRELFGVKGQSILAHTANPASMPNIDLAAHIILGNCHPYVWDVRNPAGNIFTRYPVTGAVVRGQRVIPLTNQADCDNLSVGEIIAVRDSVEYARTGYAQPDFAQWCRIRSKSGSSILLDRPVRAAIATALVAKVAGTDPYLSGASLFNTTVLWGIADSPHIHDLVFEDGWWAISGRMGAFDANIHDIECRRVAYGLGLNAFVGVVRNYRTDYSTRALEIKQSSHDVVVDNAEFTYVPFLNYENNTGTPNFVAEVGERSFNFKILNSKIWAGSEWTGAQGIVDFDDCWNGSLRDCDFDIWGGGNVALILWRGHGDTGSVQSIHSFTIANNHWQVNVAKASISSFIGQSQCPISRVLMIGNEYLGVKTSGNVGHSLTSYASKIKSIGEDLAIGWTTAGGTNSEPLYEVLTTKWS